MDDERVSGGEEPKEQLKQQSVRIIRRKKEPLPDTHDGTRSIVAKVVFRRQILPEPLKAAMERALRASRDFIVKRLRPKENLFRFRFDSELERYKALEEGLWTFSGSFVLFQPWYPDQTLDELNFTYCPLWIRMYNLPPSQITLPNAHSLGWMFGGVIEHELTKEKEEDMEWSDYLRLRVRWPTDMPLKESVLSVTEEGKELELEVRYERLPEFCSHCGIIGHTRDACEDRAVARAPNPNAGGDLYGDWLRVEVDNVYQSTGRPVTRREREEELRRKMRKEMKKSSRLSVEDRRTIGGSDMYANVPSQPALPGITI